MAPHSSTLAWKIPWTEEPGRLQSMGSRRVGHDWATSLWLFTFVHWRRKWQPTPVFLPGESQGQRSPVGCRLWGHTESDTTKVTQQQQKCKKRFEQVMEKAPLLIDCAKSANFCEVLQSFFFFFSRFNVHLFLTCGTYKDFILNKWYSLSQRKRRNLHRFFFLNYIIFMFAIPH